MNRSITVPLFLAVFAWAGSHTAEAIEGAEADAAQRPRLTAPDGEPSSPRHAVVETVELPGLQNLLRVSPRVFSGGEPASETALASLVRLGVKVVVSVDGDQPDVAAAKRHGLRYVHIPIGYDGVDSRASGSLTRLVRELSGPFYIHCHHGRHRGPAAAAIACLAAGDIDSAEAHETLRRAGTSRDYVGLWRDVSTFAPPPVDAQLPELVETAQLDSLAAAMARIDRIYDRLDRVGVHGWTGLERQSEPAAAHDALLLREAFHELGRTLSADQEYDDAFRQALTDAEARARDLERGLRRSVTLGGNSGDEISRQFAAVSASCRRCHSAYRD